MVNTRETATEVRLSHWAQIIRERQGSGLSIKEYCKQRGICGNTYYYRQRKVRAAACSQLALSDPERLKLPASHFAEVRIAERSAPQATQSGLRIEVSGVQITADSTYPTEKLAALLRELARS